MTAQSNHQTVAAKPTALALADTLLDVGASSFALASDSDGTIRATKARDSFLVLAGQALADGNPGLAAELLQRSSDCAKVNYRNLYQPKGE